MRFCALGFHQPDTADENPLFAEVRNYSGTGIFTVLSATIW